MISRRPARLGTSTRMVLSKRPGPQQRRVEVGSPVGGTDHQEVRRFYGTLARSTLPAGSHRLADVDERVGHPSAEGRDVKRLKLDEQFVDDPGDALTPGAGTEATPGSRRWRLSLR